MKPTTQFRIGMLGFCLIFFATPRLLADVTGTILGIVTDPSGAAVPGAAVMLGNASTGLNRKTTTDSVGAYEFLAVPVGENYMVEVEAKGFEKSTQSGLTLLVNQRFLADFRLVVGAVNQNVEVSAAAVQVETSSTQLGDVIEDKKMSALPLNGRSYIDLLGLQAGVVPITSGVQFTDRPVSGNGNSGNVSVNGQREAANSFLVNGGDVEEGRNNGASIVPTLDSIQEFRLITNSFDAEYGRFSGAIVNAVTKSGTNAFHGTVYEFLRNEKLDSRNLFESNQVNPNNGQELPGTARGVFRRNQFGAAGGGPILKNRLFFFSDYQGTREIRGLSTGNIPVPSLQERGGNFSDLSTTHFAALGCASTASATAGLPCTAADIANKTANTLVVQGDNGSGHQAQTLSTRLGYTVTSGEPYWIPGCNSLADAQAGTCVFPGQVIPQSAWSPVAAKALGFIPTPSGVSSGQPFFSTSAQKQTVRDDKLGERIDWEDQRTGTWTFYYHFDDATLLNPYPAANVPGFAASTPSRAQQFNMSNTHTFSPTAVNEARVNYTRSAATFRQPVEGLGKITDFGFLEGGLGIIPVNPHLEGFPYLSLGLLGVTIGLPDGTTGQFNNTYQVQDNFSKVAGRHTLKVGGEFRYIQINERNTYAQNGFFSFNGSETGNDFADYLIGAVPAGGFIQSSRQFLDSRTKYGGIYGQDTYKPKSNLTLNYGLRWEVSQPYYDTQGKIYGIVPGLQSQVYPDAPTGFVFPGDPGVPKTLAPTRYDNFGPRVGLAYSPGFTDGVLGKIFGGPGKTSIRAASGIYYTAIEDLSLFFEVGGDPFGLFYVSPSALYLEEPYKGRRSGSDPGQRFPFTIPAKGATGIWAQYLPIASSPAFNNRNVLPYAEHFSLSVQRELSRSTILTLGYVATRGHHLLNQTDFDPGNPAKCLQVRSILGAATGCGPFGEDTIYNNVNGANVYGTRPYSVTSGRLLSQGLLDFGTGNTWFLTSSNSNYNSLQVSLEKRVGALRLLGAYTWSKSLDDASGIGDQVNPYNSKVSKSLSSFDLAHNFVVSYAYDLPFDKLTSSRTGAVHNLLDGWTLTGITRLTTGLPITMSETDDGSLCGCGGVDRPNYNGQPIQFFDPRGSSNHRYFSTAPFSLETLGTAGSANRRFFHGPGLNNWDLAIHKTTRITERTSIEFRAEFFNAFNHAQFNLPSGTIGLSTFGLATGARDPRIGQIALKLYF